MVIKVVKSEKGNLVGKPFCLIDRKEQDKVKEGEKWEVEVIRTIKDKRGKEIEIVKPIRRILRLQGGKVYCGEIELGEPQIRKERELYKRTDGVGESIYEVFLYEGRELKRELKEHRVYRFHDIDKAPEDVRGLLQELIEETKKELEEERPPEEVSEKAREMVMEKAREIMEIWKSLDIEKVKEEAKKALEDAYSFPERRVFSHLRKLYGIPEGVCITMEKTSEIIPYTNRCGKEGKTEKVTIRIRVPREKPVNVGFISSRYDYHETIAEEYCIFVTTSFSYEGDREGPVYVGVGVERDVIHTTESVEKSENWDVVSELFKKYEQDVMKRFPFALAVLEREYENFNPEELERVKNNLKGYIKIYELGGYYILEYVYPNRTHYPAIGESGIYKVKKATYIPPIHKIDPEYYDVSEIEDLPTAYRMFHSGMWKALAEVLQKFS